MFNGDGGGESWFDHFDCGGFFLGKNKSCLVRLVGACLWCLVEALAVMNNFLATRQLRLHKLVTLRCACKIS